MLTEAQRKRLIRLAHKQTKVRKAVLAMLRLEAAAPQYQTYLKRKKQQGKPPLGKKEWERKVLQTGQSGEELKKEKAKGEKKPDAKKPGGDDPPSKGGEAADFKSKFLKAIPSAPGLSALIDDLPTEFLGKNEGYDHPKVKKLQKKLLKTLSPEEAKKAKSEISYAHKAMLDFLGAGGKRPDQHPPEVQKMHAQLMSAWRAIRDIDPSKATGGGKGEKDAPSKTKGDDKGDKPKGGKSYSKSYSKPVAKVMDKYSMTDDDASQVAAWKKRKPQKGTPISDAEKLRRFLAHAKPETKERMKGMSPAEFMEILSAIMDDEEGGEGKQAVIHGKFLYDYGTRHLQPDAVLRQDLIRLANEHPAMRKHIVPLLRKVGWDWRKDGIPPRDSRLVGKKWAGRVIQKFGQHHTGAPFAIIPRDTRGMPGAQDPYQKVVIQNGIITHDFGSVPQLVRRAVQLPSEESRGKPSYDTDFKAGFKVGKAAYAKDDQVDSTTAKKAYRKVSNKHGSWWVDGYTAAIDLARGAYAMKGAQIAKKLKLSFERVAAGKPTLEKEGLNKATVNAKMGFMVYHIDAEANKSKFYEVLIKDDGAGFKLLRRWGALTDSGATGRIDKREEFHPNLMAARRSMMGHYSKRMRRGYTDAFRSVSSWASGPAHTSPANGKRLPFGQYPIGLTRDPGFGWGSQSITQCIPALRALVEHIDQARDIIQSAGPEEYYPPGETIDHLTEALAVVDTVVHADSSMGNKLKRALMKAQRRAIGGKHRPDPGNRKLSGELYAIRNYITKQTGYCA